MRKELFEKLRVLIAKKRDLNKELLSEQTELLELGIDGDDALNFMREISDKFSVDLSEFEFNKYFNPPFIHYLLFARDKSPKMPITLFDLTEAVESKKWAKRSFDLSSFKINKEDWPILGVGDLQDSIKYYSDKLLFELCDDDSAAKSPTEATMKLYDVFIIFREGKKGPIYDPKKVQVKIRPNVSPMLMFPVPEPKLYFEVLKKIGAKIFSKNRFDYELEGFNVLDSEDNEIYFYHDHHNRYYEPNDWRWTWEKN